MGERNDNNQLGEGTVSKYTPRVRLGETRTLLDAVATRTSTNPDVDNPDTWVSEGRSTAIPFKGKSFVVAVTRYLDFTWERLPKEPDESEDAYWKRMDSVPSRFASHGHVRGTRVLGPRANWEAISKEAERLNRLGIRCFGDTNHRFFEGGHLVDGVFYTFFGS